MDNHRIQKTPNFYMALIVLKGVIENAALVHPFVDEAYDQALMMNPIQFYARDNTELFENSEQEAAFEIARRRTLDAASRLSKARSDLTHQERIQPMALLEERAEFRTASIALTQMIADRLPESEIRSQALVILKMI